MRKRRWRGPARCCSRLAQSCVRPGRDDKVLADWNGLAIAALARASAVFEQPEWLARAEEAQDFVLTEMSAPDGRVQHAWRLGRVTAAGLLDDQAAMARASLALFEATGEARRLAEAIWLARAAEMPAFVDGQGIYYTHGRRCVGCAAGAAAHGGGQRDTGRQRAARGGLRAALAFDR